MKRGRAVWRSNAATELHPPHQRPIDCHPGLAKPSPGSSKRKHQRLQLPQGVLGPGPPLRCVRDDNGEAAARQRGRNQPVDNLSIVIPDWRSQDRDPVDANACGSSEHRGYWVPDLRCAASGMTTERQLRSESCCRAQCRSTKLSMTFFTPAFSKSMVSLLPSIDLMAP